MPHFRLFIGPTDKDKPGLTDMHHPWRLQLGVTDENNSELPISLLRKHFAIATVISSLAPLDDSCPLPASYISCCFVMWLKDQTYLTHAPEDPFLEIDVKGSESTSKLIT